ncbi:hypothetical protein C0J56_24510 [Pseudomonas fluorescens]|nr:hypothetical protein C0J56_24510 [Pseudomonas fluorescens]
MGAGLLAKAVWHSTPMQADPTPSRASPHTGAVCDIPIKLPSRLTFTRNVSVLGIFSQTSLAR